MKIILISDVPKLGRKNDIKEVSSGYAKNFLIPKNLARPADAGLIKKVIHDQNKAESEKKAKEAVIRDALSEISDQVFIITAKIGKKGELFASVNEDQIKKVVKSVTGIDIKSATLKDKSVKKIGEYEAIIDGGYNITARIKIKIEPES